MQQLQDKSLNGDIVLSFKLELEEEKRVNEFLSEKNKWERINMWNIGRGSDPLERINGETQLKVQQRD